MRAHPRAYLAELARASDLLVVEIATTLSAFVAEDVPGSIMRGVPREEWDARGLSDDEIRAIASVNTEERFAPLVQRINTIERIPADGWRMAGDVLYQGSVLMAPLVLAALVERSAGDVLVATPDRGSRAGHSRSAAERGAFSPQGPARVARGHESLLARRASHRRCDGVVGAPAPVARRRPGASLARGVTIGGSAPEAWKRGGRFQARGLAVRGNDGQRAEGSRAQDGHCSAEHGARRLSAAAQ